MSRLMAVKLEAILSSSVAAFPFDRRFSIVFALFKAASYDLVVNPRSLPMALTHTAPLLLGATPRHQSSLVLFKLVAASQFGRT